MGERTSWYQRLLHCRKDVSHLSYSDLLILDLKMTKTQEGHLVAFSSIFKTLGKTLEDAGGWENVLNLTRVFAAEHNNCDVVLALFDADEGRKGIIVVPREDAQAPICRDIVARLMAAPRGLPEAFRTNDIFKAQGVLDDGFNLQAQDALQPLLPSLCLGR